MSKPVFTGSGVAIVTPFTKDGIDFDTLGSLIEFQIANSTDAIIICGTTGESATMPDEEHCAAIKFAVDKVAGRVPVIAGTGSNDTPHGVKLSQYAESVGVDALLVVTPYYNKTTQKGLVAHFGAIADAVHIPLILYNVPSRTGLNITPQTLVELAKIENITAIKEASGNIVQAANMARLCPDIDIYSGNDDMIVPILSLGGKGVISVLANVAPKQTHDITAAYFAGDVKTACKLQLQAMELIDALFCEVNPIPVKTALNLMGMQVGNLRLPLVDMEQKNLETLKTALANYGLL